MSKKKEEKKEVEEKLENAEEKEVDSSFITKKEFDEIVEALKAKNDETLKERKKEFSTNPSKENEFKFQGTKKRSKTVNFLNAISNKDGQYLSKAHAERAKALNEGTGSAGGYLVPEEFETEVTRLVNEYSVIRQDARVISMSTDTKKLNTNSANPTVYYVDELDTITGSQNTLAEPELSARKIAGIVDWSNELIEDEENSLISLIQETLAEEIAQKEENEFVNGTELGSEGLLQVSGVTATTLESGSTFSDLTFDDLSAMQKKLFNDVSNQMAMRGTFYMSMTAYDALRTQKDDNNAYILPPVPSDDMPARAWGLRIRVVPSFPTTTATDTKFVVFSDLKKTAVIGDRQGMRVKIFDSGSVVESGGSERNLITTDAQALRITKRTAFTTQLQTGIVTLATNS